MPTAHDALTLRCTTCGSLNRIDRHKLDAGLAPVCGRCGAALPSAANIHPITVTDADFAQQVERSPLPVLLDLWAPWCGPCRMLTPILEELASDFAGRARIAKLNVDENPAAAARFSATSIPLLIILENGREVDRLVGAHPKAAIAGRLQPHLDQPH